MPTEDTTPETPETPATAQDGAREPVPNPVPQPQPQPVDIEALLAAERARLQADLDQRIEQARAEAIAAEKARVAEEQRLAALTEAEREQERLRVAEEKQQNLARELDEAKRLRAEEAARAARELRFANAIAEGDLRFARGSDGTTDPALRELAFNKASELIAASEGKLTEAQALAQLATTSPWMFARTEAPVPGSTNTGSPGAPASRVPAPPPRKLDVIHNDDDYYRGLELLRLNASNTSNRR